MESIHKDLTASDVNSVPCQSQTQLIRGRRVRTCRNQWWRQQERQQWNLWNTDKTLMGVLPLSRAVRMDISMSCCPSEPMRKTVICTQHTTTLRSSKIKRFCVFCGGSTHRPHLSLASSVQTSCQTLTASSLTLIILAMTAKRHRQCCCDTDTGTSPHLKVWVRLRPWGCGQCHSSAHVCSE